MLPPVPNRRGERLRPSAAPRPCGTRPSQVVVYLRLRSCARDRPVAFEEAARAAGAVSLVLKGLETAFGEDVAGVMCARRAG